MRNTAIERKHLEAFRATFEAVHNDFGANDDFTAISREALREYAKAILNKYANVLDLCELATNCLHESCETAGTIDLTKYDEIESNL